MQPLLYGILDGVHVEIGSYYEPDKEGRLLVPLGGFEGYQFLGPGEWSPEPFADRPKALPLVEHVFRDRL